MTSPTPERISIQCPKCSHVFEAWYRPVSELEVEEATVPHETSSTCPDCGATIRHSTLNVSLEGVFEIS